MLAVGDQNTGHNQNIGLFFFFYKIALFYVFWSILLDTASLDFLFFFAQGWVLILCLNELISTCEKYVTLKFICTMQTEKNQKDQPNKHATPQHTFDNKAWHTSVKSDHHDF